MVETDQGAAEGAARRFEAESEPRATPVRDVITVCAPTFLTRVRLMDLFTRRHRRQRHRLACDVGLAPQRCARACRGSLLVRSNQGWRE